MAKKKNIEIKEEELKYVHICKYDPLKDAQELIPDLGVNVDDMLQTGVVKDSGETLDNNGLDNPDRIIGRIRDVFDAMDATRIIKKYGKKAKQSNTEVSNVINRSDSQPTNE